MALLLSLGVHVLAVAWLVPGFVRSRSGTAIRPVSLASLSRAEWEQNRRTAPAVDSASAEAAPERPPQVPLRPAPRPPDADPTPRGQIVDLGEVSSPVPPPESRFLAERDSTVEKESRSRHASARYERALPRPTTTDASKPTPVAAEPMASGRADAVADQPSRQEPSGAAASRPPPTRPTPAADAAGAGGAGPASRTAAARNEIAMRADPGGDRPSHVARPLTARQGGEAGAADSFVAREQPDHGDAPREPFDPRRFGMSRDGDAEPAGDVAPARLGSLQLRPTAATYERVAGGPAPDHLPGIEEGEGTYLNARSWKYAAYFNRISQAVRGEWSPGSAMQARDPRGARYGSRTWSTVLSVKLDADGSVKDLSVQRPSGLAFLDEVALEAVRRAQPFANPPRGLADDRGEIVFSYGFRLDPARGFGRLFGGSP